MAESEQKADLKLYLQGVAKPFPDDVLRVAVYR
jgi:hypothetical protein